MAKLAIVFEDASDHVAVTLRSIEWDEVTETPAVRLVNAAIGSFRELQSKIDKGELNGV